MLYVLSASLLCAYMIMNAVWVCMNNKRNPMNIYIVNIISYVD